MKNLLKTLKNSIANAVYPANYTCNICGIEVFDDRPFCEDCVTKINFINENYCQKCGRILLSSEEACSSCNHEWAIDKARSLFEYSGYGKYLIQNLKYNNSRYLAEVFALLLKDLVVKNFFAPDVITFVPMDELSEYKRGYNQSQLIAEALAKTLDNEVIGGLIKKNATENQQTLDFFERQKNLKNSFAVTDKLVFKNKNVLLVDDVLTTGATSNEVAKVLKKAGAKSVYLLTLASVTSKSITIQQNLQKNNALSVDIVEKI